MGVNTGRKLAMIVGDDNGKPHDNTIRRLARMVVKLENDESVPDEVRAFIEENELGSAIQNEIDGNPFGVVSDTVTTDLSETGGQTEEPGD